MKDKIQAIILDLGGVILNIDPDRTVEKMKEIGLENFDQAYSSMKQNHIFDRLEKGEIGEAAFYREIQQYGKKSIPVSALREAWNALLLDFPGERIVKIRKLKKDYPLFLLSNTNEIHYKKYMDDFFNIYGYSFVDLFEKSFFSHQLGMRKPDSVIFEFVKREISYPSDKILFVDDSLVNVESAVNSGLQAIHLDLKNGDSLEDLLDNFPNPNRG